MSTILGKAFADAVLRTESVDVSVIVETAKKYAKEILKDLDSFGTWRPDKEGLTCAICKKEFGRMRRRHHCRSCGGLICDGCSTTVKRADVGKLLEHPAKAKDAKSKEARICKECEHKI